MVTMRTRVVLGLALAAVMAGAAPAAAQQILFDDPVRAGDLMLFRDLSDEKAYYYMPTKPRLSTGANGQKQFSFFRWVDNSDVKDEAAAREGEGGGIIHALVTFGVSKEQLMEAERDLQRQRPGARIAGPIVPKSATVGIVSAALAQPKPEEGADRPADAAAKPTDKTSSLAEHVVGLGKAPMLDGDKTSVSILLTKQGAKILWEQFQMATANLDFAFEMVVQGFRKPQRVVIEADLDQIVKHDSFAAGIAGTWFAGEIKGAFDELRKKNVIRVTEIGGSAKEASSKDDPFQERFKAVYDRLIDILFEKPGEGGTANAAAAASAVTGVDSANKGMMERATEQLKTAKEQAAKNRKENAEIRARNAPKLAKRQELENARRIEREEQAKLQKAETALAAATSRADLARADAAARAAAAERAAAEKAAAEKAAAEQAAAKKAAADKAAAEKAAAEKAAAEKAAAEKAATEKAAAGDAAKTTSPSAPATATAPAAGSETTPTPAATGDAAAPTPPDGTTAPAGSTAPSGRSASDAAPAAAPVPQVSQQELDTLKLAVETQRVKYEAARDAAQKLSVEVANMEPMEPERDEVSDPSFAVLGTYQLKRQRQTGIFRVDLNKYMPEDRTFPFRENIGDLRALARNPAHFRQINLDDPLYRQREIVAVLDIRNAGDFDKFVNFAAVRLRKKHESGELTHEEIRIDRNNFKKEGAHFKMLYGWKGDNNRNRWMDYEYQEVWSFAGGHQVEQPWKAWSANSITLSPPMQRRSVDLASDPKKLADNDVRSVTVKVYYRPAEGAPEQVRQVSLNAAAPAATQIEFVLPSNALNYDYEISWRLSGNRTVSTGRQTTSEPILYVDELPAKPSGTPDVR